MSLGISSYAQLQPLLDQHHLNGLAINPAYAGSQGALNIGLYSRIQWVGFEGAPRTNTFSIQSPLRNKKVNLGLIVMGDRLGSKRETGFLLNYAYRIDLGRGKWSLGLAAGVSNISTKLSSLRYADMADRLLQNPGQSTLLPEFSLGSYYYTDRYYAGISMPLFLSHYSDEENGSYEMKFRPGEANYILTGGYLFELSHGIELLPSILLKSNPVNNTLLDIHCNLILHKKVWIGSAVRTNGSMSALFQLQANQQLRIGYAYGYEFSELSSYQHGSHELVLQYNFKYILEVISPRYF